MERRKFIKSIGTAGTILTIPGISNHVFSQSKDMFFKISLAEWSLREVLWSKEISNLDFPKYTKDEFGINAVEYVSSFFNKQESDMEYLKDLKSRTDGEGITNVLIMVDMYNAGGRLASPVSEERKTAVENHKKWVDIAKFLGCHAIRVNALGYDKASREDASEYFTEGLSMLVEYGNEAEINVVVENHGGYSSDAKWLTGVMKKVNNPRCGTLPDFGNFRISKTEVYDTYQGIEELMPYALGVSAKTIGFNDDGEESNVDINKILKIVKDAGYTGHIGIEWGGGKKSGSTFHEGIMLTKKLLEKYGKQLT